MNNGFPVVPLENCLMPIERPETPILGKIYRQVGVRLWGEGAYERESIDGGQTKYSTLSRVETDDIIVNKIWARNGSVAVVPPLLAGCYGSGEFPTFTPIQNRLNPRWFHWFTKTKVFWRQCDEKSRGTSGKNRIRPEKFLEITIPLPPLEEQQRIVARIEELAGRIEEARGLRREAVKGADTLLSSTLESLFEGKNARHWSYRKLTDSGLATVIAGQHIMAEEYNMLGNGFPYLTGPADFGARVPEIRRWTQTPKSTALPGDVLLTVKGAGVGKINFAPDVEVAIGRQLMAIRPDPAKLTQDFIFFFLEHKFKHFQSIATATTVPGFKKTDVEELRIPVPEILEQQDIIVYLNGLEAKVDALKQIQSKTSAELDALLPSILDKAFKGEL